MKMLLAAALVGGACCATPAFAEPQVDQVNLITPLDIQQTYNMRAGPYQSFTAGLTGALVSFGLQLKDPVPSQLDVALHTFDPVRRFRGERLGTASFSHVTLPGTAAEVWFFSTDLFVVAGQQYVIRAVASNNEGSWRGVHRNFGNGQAGGTYRLQDFSFGFVTNVDTDIIPPLVPPPPPPPSAIPEPVTWAMMVGGFGLIGGAARRRRQGVAKISFGTAG